MAIDPARKEEATRRLIIVVAAAAAVLAGTAVPVLASQFSGQLGYEGQPGNQGGGQHHAPGLAGYEGQPGHQGG